MAIVTLSTDIGTGDFISGAIKGQLLSAVPNISIADITHELDADNYMQAAYICRAAFNFYPANTFHFVIINLFHQTPTYLLAAKYNDQYLVCPDNGILTIIAGEKPQEIFAIDVYHSPGKSLTVLDCAAAFADFVFKVNNGNAPSTFCREAVNIDEKLPLRPTIGADWIDAQIINIDNFNNVVLNITKDEFEELRKGRNFTISLPAHDSKQGIADMSTHYNGVKQGSTLAWFNAAGYLELAINKGNVAVMFGLQKFSEKEKNKNKFLLKKLMYQRVKIFFE